MKPRSLRTLLHDRGAAIAPMIAALGASLLAAGGLALDVGLYYVDNRDLRGATEAAALSAALDPANAEARARASLSRHGYDPGLLQSVEIGRYCADSHLAADQRFDTSFSRCPGNGLANAVRLHTEKPSRRFLTGILGGAVIVPDLASTATAARIDEAGIGITSDILTEVLSGLRPVSDPLVATVNELLGGLLGVPLHLSKADVEGLMRGNVDAGLFFDKLASKEGHTGTYGELMNNSHGLKDIAEAAAEAASNPATAAALNTFAAQANNGYRIPFSDLFGLGVWQNMPVGEADAKPALRAGLNAYQLITFAVQAGPGVIDASDLLNLVMQGNSNVLRITAIANGPGGEPSFSFGSANETRVSTSKLRLQVELLSNIPLGLLELPLLVDVAPATASITGIDCPSTPDQALDTTVRVEGKSGLVNVYIGKPKAGAMSESMPEITGVDPANILLGLATVSAHARIGDVFAGQGGAAFGPNRTNLANPIGSPEAPGGAYTIRNQADTDGLVQNLVNSLDVHVLGLDLGGLLRAKIVSQLLSPVQSLLGQTADPLLDNVLAALGIQLGTASIWATGARCGVPVLV